MDNNISVCDSERGLVVFSPATHKLTRLDKNKSAEVMAAGGNEYTRSITLRLRSLNFVFFLSFCFRSKERSTKNANEREKRAKKKKKAIQTSVTSGDVLG